MPRKPLLYRPDRKLGPTASLLAPRGLALVPSLDSGLVGKAVMPNEPRLLLLLDAPLPVLPTSGPVTLPVRAELMTARPAFRLAGLVGWYTARTQYSWFSRWYAVIICSKGGRGCQEGGGSG